MVLVKRSFFIALGFFLAFIVSACGGSTSSTSGNAAPTTSNPTATTGPGALIKTASVLVNGKSETILTNAQGKTLYYFTPDTATTSACTGSCAQNWPPLLATGSSAPTSTTTLPGKLTTLSTPAGKQVLYNGHLLYTFAGDSAPGQLNGEGKLGKWFVATADLTAQSNTSSGSASTVVIKTATATVGGKSETILTTSQGMTLYYFTADTATKTACTGACATSWPPLLFAGAGKPAASTKLSGELEVYQNANGNQIIYNDHPLYTFSGDSAAGQTNGQGVGGKWFVATPNLTKNT
jgi:predicted lipoprotein with Yx(FWY)xxD motif